MSDQTITSLIEKLEGAEVGDRMLDAQLWCAVNGLIWKKPIVVPGLPGRFYSFRTNRGDIGLHGDDQRGPVKQYTTSLDAALALAERVLDQRGPININICLAGSAQVVIDSVGPCDPVMAQVVAATPALALCAAILRAQSEAR